MAFGYDGSIRIKADLNHGPFDQGLSSITKQVNTFGNTLKKIGGLVAMAFGTAALINFGKESIKLASDIQEVQNVIDVTFGQGAKQIEEFAQSAAEAYGLSELAAKQYTGTMGAMLKSSGLATSAAQEMSMVLTGLAGDVASFYNLDTDTAFEKIRSGISGETEPLKQLGINMSVANLEAYALSKGITKSYNAMSQAEQVLLRYNYLLSVTTDAQGDFARTSGSFANQIRILQLNFDQLRIAVGNALIPIAQAVLPSINAIISGLTKLAKVFAQVTALLFGKSPEVKATSGIAASAGAAADATDKLAESTAGAGSAAKQAEKDMKGVLASFDELNILASNAAGSVGGAGGGAGADIPDLEIPSYEAEIEQNEKLGESYETLGELFMGTIDKILESLPELREALLEAAKNFNEFNQKLYDAFTTPGLKEKVQQLGRELADIMNEFVDAIDWELWGRALGAGLNLALNFLTSFLYEFDWVNLGRRLAEFINGLVYEIDWYEFGRLLWAKFKIALETFAGFILGLDMPALAKAASDIIMGFFDEMKKTIEKIEWGEIGKQIARFLNGIEWTDIIKSISGALKEMVNAAIEFVGGFISEADPDTLLVAAAFLGSKLLGGLISKVLGPIAKEVGSNLIKKIAESITNGESTSLLTSIGTMFSTAFSSAKDIVSDFGGKISDVFAIANSSAYSFSDAVQMVFGPGSIIAGIAGIVGGALLAVDNFLKMLENGFNWVNEALMLVGIAIAGIGAVILGAPALVVGVVAGIVAAVATAVVLIKEHWEEIGEFFSQLFESIGNWASETLDGICEYWSGVGEWWNENVITPIAEFFFQLGEDIANWASETVSNIQEFWSGVGAWFDENVTRPIGEFFSSLWDNVSKWASDAWGNVQEAWKDVGTWFKECVTEPIKKFFSDLWDNTKKSASGAWDGVKNIWESAANWFNEIVVEPIENFFSGLWDGIKGAASDAWTSITQTFSNVGNWFSNNVINKLRVPSAGRAVSYSSPEMQTYNLPHLANGAVIPPNQQFAAILGDQRSGKNLEAPANLIRQMVAEGIQAAGGVGRNSGNMTIIMEIDGREFGRASYKYGTAEQQRVGVRLAEVRS